MSYKRKRFIGTSEEAIAKAEKELNFKFSFSFRSWIIQNNGLGIEGVNVIPVFDERDPQKNFRFYCQKLQNKLVRLAREF